ncbi:unnamed protein product [Mytilus edulis]|uniref:Uncharacterized protein n=1 Tax=Mytilus edulis TaxID=6550 RepID=A0A8S3RXM4_MYTED|nr:unnamed protein product [Mytilus edulis]
MRDIFSARGMSDINVLKRGRKPTLTDSAKKRRHTAVNAKCNKNRIYLGAQYDRWSELKCALRLQSHAEVAKILLDSPAPTCGAMLKETSSASTLLTTSTPGPLQSKLQQHSVHLSDVSEISSSEREHESRYVTEIITIMILSLLVAVLKCYRRVVRIFNTLNEEPQGQIQPIGQPQVQPNQTQGQPMQPPEQLNQPQEQLMQPQGQPIQP